MWDAFNYYNYTIIITTLLLLSSWIAFKAAHNFKNDKIWLKTIKKINLKGRVVCFFIDYPNFLLLVLLSSIV